VVWADTATNTQAAQSPARWQQLFSLMFRIIIILSIAFLYSCSGDSKKGINNQPNDTKLASVDSLNDELKLEARYNSFDTTVEMLFWNTKNSINEIQRKNYEGFISKQDRLTPEILNKIFEFYKQAYPAYKKGWTMNGNITDKELEKYLPKPTTPDALKKFITPGIVHIQNENDCKLGTICIEFDCTWDIENGLGVTIENWKVIAAGVAETSYFLSGVKP